MLTECPIAHHDNRAAWSDGTLSLLGIDIESKRRLQCCTTTLPSFVEESRLLGSQHGDAHHDRSALWPFAVEVDAATTLSPESAQAGEWQLTAPALSPVGRGGKTPQIHGQEDAYPTMLCIVFRFAPCSVRESAPWPALSQRTQSSNQLRERQERPWMRLPKSHLMIRSGCMRSFPDGTSPGQVRLRLL